jgi:hypothetical protein
MYNQLLNTNYIAVMNSYMPAAGYESYWSNTMGCWVLPVQSGVFTGNTIVCMINTNTTSQTMSATLSQMQMQSNTFYLGNEFFTYNPNSFNIYINPGQNGFTNTIAPGVTTFMFKPFYPREEWAAVNFESTTSFANNAVFTSGVDINGGTIFMNSGSTIDYGTTALNLYSPANGQFIAYNSTLNQWLPSNAPAGGGGSTSFNASQFSSSGGTTNISTSASFTNALFANNGTGQANAGVYITTAGGATRHALTITNASGITYDQLGNGAVLQSGPITVTNACILDTAAIGSSFGGALAVGGHLTATGGINISTASPNTLLGTDGASSVVNYTAGTGLAFNSTSIQLDATRSLQTTIGYQFYGGGTNFTLSTPPTNGFYTTVGTAWTNVGGQRGEATIPFSYSTSAGAGWGAQLYITNYSGPVGVAGVITNVHAYALGNQGLTGLAEGGSNYFRCMIYSNSVLNVIQTAGTITALNTTNDQSSIDWQ